MFRFCFISAIKKKGQIIAGTVVCVSIMAIIGAYSSIYANEKHVSAPPLTGWMENFQPTLAPYALPETIFTDENGDKLTLKSFRGKIILLNFWATWCGPCVREMPSLRRLHNELKGPDFTVIALSEDRIGWQKIGTFRDKLNLGELPLYHDVDSKMMYAAKARGLPTTLLIDREGNELGRLVGLAEWDTAEAIALVRYYIAKR